MRSFFVRLLMACSQVRYMGGLLGRCDWMKAAGKLTCGATYKRANGGVQLLHGWLMISALTTGSVFGIIILKQLITGCNIYVISTIGI